MDGSQCRDLRRRLGLSQARLAFQCQVDASLLCRFEQGVAKLRPTQMEVLRSYLGSRLIAVKREFAHLELPSKQVDSALREVLQ